MRFIDVPHWNAMKDCMETLWMMLDDAIEVRLVIAGDGNPVDLV